MSKSKTIEPKQIEYIRKNKKEEMEINSIEDMIDAVKNDTLFHSYEDIKGQLRRMKQHIDKLDNPTQKERVLEEATYTFKKYRRNAVSRCQKSIPKQIDKKELKIYRKAVELALKYEEYKERFKKANSPGDLVSLFEEYQDFNRKINKFLKI